MMVTQRISSRLPINTNKGNLIKSHIAAESNAPVMWKLSQNINVRMAKPIMISNIVSLSKFLSFI